jgi:hypothetical protein
MKNKTIAVIGIGSYILSVLASATDADGNFVSPAFLIVVSAIVTTVFIVMATVRLWKEARYVSIIFASSAVLLFVSTTTHDIGLLLSNGNGLVIVTGLLTLIIKPINFIASIWAIIKLWAMAKHEGLVKKKIEKYGLTPEEGSLVQEDLRKGDQESAVQRITTAQERHRTKFKEATGIDPFAIIPVVGQDIKWTDIVRQVFRVLEFDRAGTIVLADGTVKAATPDKPYGYLLVESPILNVKARLPITHSADFALAASAYDVPQLAEMVAQEELLVTYFPKQKLPMGLAGITHALHYVVVPRGTLERYYEFNNDEHMANPAPEKLFNEFAWDGEIRVGVNPAPEF